MNPVAIAVAPPEFRSRHRWLFDNLERVYPVAFVPRTLRSVPAGEPAIVLADELPDLPAHIPRTLVYLSGPDDRPVHQEIGFTGAGVLDERLRGRVLEERSLPPLEPLVLTGGDTLAQCNGGPVWVRRRGAGGPVDVVRLPAGAACRERMLWDNIQEHRFFFLMTMVHHLYAILAGSGWTPPPLRAAFVVDDPNFRSMRYGHFRFADVARLARAERFHVSIATAPIDLAVTSRRMAAFLAAHADVLSVSIHGNDHIHHELLLPGSEEAALPVLCRMMTRVEEFERRHRLPVSRVLVPPNELCSAPTLRALRRFPVAAVCTSRPWPWLPGDTWADTAGPEDGMLCWQPGDRVEEGMAVIRRSMIPNNMVFRAFLNQPVIRYFHHTEFRDGMDLPRTTADEINTLGGVQWMSLGELAATNVESRVHGNTMIVRPFSRHVQVAVPEPVTHLRVEGEYVSAAESVVLVDGVPRGHDGRGTDPAVVRAGTVVEVQLVHTRPVEIPGCSGASTSPGAWAHRRLSETVDRLRLPR